MDCIKGLSRPNLSEFTDEELYKIISDNSKSIESIKSLKIFEQYSREEMVRIIFSMWSAYELVDIDECKICWDNLTNGNNMTFECGHKFHSTCIIKSLLFHSTSVYSDYLDDKEKDSVSIDFNCPQCKKHIDSVKFTKK